jgi:predicted nucleic acid-binding protein
MLRAILDTCVLYSQLLRDVLLRLAAAGLYEPVWSPDILEELRRHIPTPPDKAERTIALMQSAFPLATVTIPPESLDNLQTHPKDRHVLAAAIRASASLIVTHNVRDFPPDALAPHKIEAWTPDRFLTSLLQQDPKRVLAVLRYMSSILHSPPLTPRELAEALLPLTPEFSQQAQALLD